MINPKKLMNILVSKNISFYCGVPDSILKFFTEQIDLNKKLKNIITVNEGSSVALAAGYYLSSNKVPCVYMQNSGLGNAINPLASIVHKQVYSLPMLLMIGWRGALKEKDEPQHKVKGEITKKILSSLKIKHIVLSSKNLNSLKKLIDYSKKHSSPVACLVRNRTIKKIKNSNKKKHKGIENNIKRSFVILNLLKHIKKNTKIISTTGYTSRELFQLREKFSIINGSDFYMVGGMGHSSILSLGVSLNLSDDVICLDGDGSFLMHLGSTNTIGVFGKKNFKHILFNNYSHESTGAQSTYSENINFKKLVFSMGYKSYKKIKYKQSINNSIKTFLKLQGPSFLEIETSVGSINNLSRPKNFLKIKNDFKN